ncbi:ABC-type uncharacterized transport system substrate-binding protein [Hallerella porci]|uniref:ABC-type uncharacterized transport system substrate-binding protein n=2 Tax=Fibrobacteraceae TaxID=204431 RepID=A0ABX5LQ22_9BACT|nr:ABC-type uncharacterized transport system substrate-binding protein [Hallerella porci]
MMSRFIFLLFALAGIAFAHPHIFIDATTDVIFNETEFVGVQNSWTFDPIYSQAMFATGDKNGDGKIDESELSFFQKKAIDEFISFSRFNYIGDGTQFYIPKEIQNLKVFLNKENRLVIQFLNAFHIPANSSDYTMIVLVVNDPSNYISITIDMEKAQVKSPSNLEVDYFVDALEGLTQFQNFSKTVKGLYVRYKKSH